MTRKGRQRAAGSIYENVLPMLKAWIAARVRYQLIILIFVVSAVVYIDPSSLDLLEGSELDYVEALIGSHFAVKNPQAASACGCGTSFALA